jgi:hypothetical protein
VDYLDPGFFHHGQPLLRVVAGCFHGFHAAIDNGLDIGGVVRRFEDRQESQVDAKGFVGHFITAGDLLREVLGRGLGQPGNNAQGAGVGDGRSKFSKSDIVHSTLDNRMFDAKKFCNACFHFIQFRRVRRASILLPETGCKHNS